MGPMMCMCMPFLQVLLLDEITVDLDVLARADLLDFLKEESEQRGTSIIYVCEDHFIVLLQTDFYNTFTTPMDLLAPH